MPRLSLVMTQTGELPCTSVSVQLPVCYMMVSTIETTLMASTIQQYCVVMLSLPPAQAEQEGYPSRDLQCQGELSPPSTIHPAHQSGTADTAP